MIKGILFEYYTSLHNETVYNRINIRAKEYLNKINKGVFQRRIYNEREKIRIE